MRHIYAATVTLFSSNGTKGFGFATTKGDIRLCFHLDHHRHPLRAKKRGKDPALIKRTPSEFPKKGDEIIVRLGIRGPDKFFARWWAFASDYRSVCYNSNPQKHPHATRIAPEFPLNNWKPARRKPDYKPRKPEDRKRKRNGNKRKQNHAYHGEKHAH